MRKLTFAGQASAVIPASAPLLSDPVDLPVKALSDVSLSLYFPEDTGLCTCHQLAVQDGFVSGPGDFTASEFTAAQTVQSRAFVSGVEVEVAHGKTIVVLGDSISDGVGSTQNANHRWPDVFARRLNLAARPGGSRTRASAAIAFSKTAPVRVRSPASTATCSPCPVWPTSSCLKASMIWESALEDGRCRPDPTTRRHR